MTSHILERVPLQQVRLLPGEHFDAQQAGARYLLDLDVDRLLYPFRREAGLPQPTDADGNPAAGQVVGVLDAPVGTPGGVLAQVTTGADVVATFSTLSARVVIIDSFFVLYIGAGTQLSTSLGTISYTARSSS